MVFILGQKLKSSKYMKRMKSNRSAKGDTVSLEKNRKDFENALNDMKDSIETMELCIKDVLLDTMKNVIIEYGQYEYSIDDLISERNDLQNEIDATAL